MSITLEPTPANDLSFMDVRILLVEDVEISRSYLTSFLSRRCRQVYSAADGKAGLRLFEQHHPDIVITDIRMPTTDGLEMSRVIRGLDSEVPIILLTGHSDLELMQQSIELQALQYIIKPLVMEKLADALRVANDKVVARRRLNNSIGQLLDTVQHFQEEQQLLSEYVTRLLGDECHAAVKSLTVAKDTISGDFFAVEQAGSALYVMLGDGTGHGLKAILPALDLPKRFHNLAGQGFGLLRIAGELNQVLYDHHMAEHFVAATLIRMDSDSRSIEILNCGNPSCLLVDESGVLVSSFASNHPAWGIVNGEDFAPDLQNHLWHDHFKLYVFSDGLTETLEHLHQQPGLTLLTAMLDAQSLADIGHWLNQLPPAQRHDDITLLEIAMPQPAVAATTTQPRAFDVAQLLHPMTALKDLSALYVEDDPIAQHYLTHFLANRLGAVYTASNGEEGLRLFKKYRPQLVISDLAMPAMDGMKMVEAIRELDPLVPVILTSGASSWLQNRDKLTALLEFPVSKFLVKPIKWDKLQAAIEQCYQQIDYISGLQLSASVFMNSPLAITVTDAQRNIVAVNPAFTAITGYAQNEVMGLNPKILGSGRHDREFYRQMWGCIEERDRWSGEIWNRRKDGTVFLEWINIIAIRDQSGQISHYASVFADITQRAIAEEKLHHLAHHDALTNLPNRALFRDRLHQALLQAQREQSKLAVVYLDVDHFKNINDTLGHSAGDELICAVAQTLQTTVRESDTVSRLGGDEFAILLPNVGSAQMAARLVVKLFNTVSRHYTVNGKELRVNVSMGISMYPDDGEDYETLIKRADNAMYQAKKRGRAEYQFFSYALERQAKRQMIIQQSFHKALDQGEFFIHYQPKYALDIERIIGTEALLRWNHAELGAISPAEFIPIAEETGFIIDLGNWLIAEVCKELTDWQAMAIDSVPIAINISPIHFHRGNLLGNLLNNLSQYRIPASLLQIELTESVVMSNQAQTLNQLQALKERGIAISIDDFGTGYSSLSYLRQLPIDELKIDRSFIMEIVDTDSLNDSRLTAIPSAIIELARKLKLKIVAEGVETETQRDFLQQNGCQVIQGFLFSKPLDNMAIQALLKSNR